MKSIKEVNTPLYKLILPWKIKFDSFSFKLTSKYDFLDNSGRITIRLYDFNDMSELQNNWLDGASFYRKNDMSLMTIKSDCSSNLLNIIGASVTNITFEKFEIEFYFDSFLWIESPQESISYIRDIKINQLLG